MARNNETLEIGMEELVNGPFHAKAKDEGGNRTVAVGVTHPRWTVSGVIFERNTVSGELTLTIEDEFGDADATLPKDVVEFVFEHLGFSKPSE